MTALMILKQYQIKNKIKNKYIKYYGFMGVYIKIDSSIFTNIPDENCGI